MWDQWVARGEFQDKPIKRGVQEIERLRKSSWRKHFSSAEDTYLSRLKAVMKAVEVKAEEETGSIESAIRFLDDIFKERCNGTLYQIHKWVKEQGLVAKKAKRGHF